MTTRVSDTAFTSTGTMTTTEEERSSRGRGAPTEAAENAVLWNVDVPHSEVNFKVTHFFTPVTGTFRSYDIDLFFDRQNPGKSTVSVRIDVRSIDTRNEDRDAHLLSPDFFDADAYPEIRFESSGVKEVGPDRFLAHGELTIKETTKEVDLPVHFLGVKDIPEEVGDALGGIRQAASFESELRIDRREFEIGVGRWAGTLVVGAKVDVSISVEATRK